MTVTSVRPHGQGYLVRTDRGTWQARTVVVATGAIRCTGPPGRAAAAGDHLA